MRITLILRGAEWLSTLPLHVQLFEALGVPLIPYAHTPLIGKMEGTSRRKLSKRKDPEAAVSYYYDKGYPLQAILEYLLNIANSSFEDWRKVNPTCPIEDFELKLERMSSSIALHDPQKLDSVSKDIIAQYPTEKLYEEIRTWSRQHDPLLAGAVEADPEYSRRVFALNAAMVGQAQRKDLACWSDVRRAYGFFFDPIYQESIAGVFHFPAVDREDITKIVEYCAGSLRGLPDKETWLAGMRQFSESIGFAADRKAYKQDPACYKGVFGDVMMVLRVALTNQQQTPDLYDIIQIMGSDRAVSRLEANLKK